MPPDVAAILPTAMDQPALRAAAALGALTANQIVPILLMIGGVLLLVLAVRRGPSGRNSETAPHGPMPAPNAEPLQQVMRDAQELADLLAAQMDRQAARLERLIAEADERIRRLERLSAAAAEPRAPTVVDHSDPLSRRVYELADEGLPPVEIARALSQPTGKVELILALRQR